jgi:hypothetical protein
MKSKLARSGCWVVPSVALGLLASALSGCSNSSDSSTTSSNSLAAAGGASAGAPGQAGSSASGGTTGTATGGGLFDTTGDDSVVCQSAIFCDNFESFAAGSVPNGAWTPTQNNGTVAVDNTRSFRGGQSVKASTVATGDTGITYKQAFLGLTQPPVIPLANDTVYGRMMFYVESAPTTSVHWTFIDGNGTVPGSDFMGQPYTSVYRYGGQKPITDANGTFVGNQLMANYDTLGYYSTPVSGPRSDCYQHSDAKTVPVGEWACAEWLFDGTNNRMRFWLNGSEITSLDVEGKGQGCADTVPADYIWAAPTFSKLDVGWESYQADDARTIWIDDVVLSSTQVGCPLAK